MVYDLNDNYNKTKKRRKTTKSGMGGLNPTRGPFGTHEVNQRDAIRFDLTSRPSNCSYVFAETRQMLWSKCGCLFQCQTAVMEHQHYLKHAKVGLLKMPGH